MVPITGQTAEITFFAAGLAGALLASQQPLANPEIAPEKISVETINVNTVLFNLDTSDVLDTIFVQSPG